MVHITSAILPAMLPLLLISSAPTSIDAFVTPSARPLAITTAASSSSLRMAALDPVTYLRTEWVSAALVTNQTPRSADKVLQLGCEDGRAVNFIPRTVRELITSSAEPLDSQEEGRLTVTCERQLRQQAERRRSAAITYSNQAADNLVDTPSSSIDVVISLQAAQRMHDNGYDWKKSIREAGRVLKPGGRFLFVEAADVDGESYLDEVIGLSEFNIENKEAGTGDDDGNVMIYGSGDNKESEEGDEEEEVKSLIFEEVGYDQVDMVLVPHMAGIAVKALDADLTPAQKAQKVAQEESDRLADISLTAFERGNKRRKRKKKKDQASTGMGN